MKNILFFVSITLLVCTTLPAAEMRQWIGSNGKAIEAEFLGRDGEIVRLKMKDGKEINVLLKLFSAKDQEFIKKGETPMENPFGNDSPKDKTNQPAKSSGKEMLGMTTFDEINPQFWKHWNWQTSPAPTGPSVPCLWEPVKSGPLSIENSVLKIVPSAETTPPRLERLRTFMFGLQKDKTYQFSVEIKADKNSRVQIRAENSEMSPLNLGLAESIQVGTEWKKQSVEFKVLRDCPSAQISFNYFNPGCVYEIREVSLCEISENQNEAATTERLGSEVLPISKFENGYLPARDGSAWSGGVDLISNENGVLRMHAMKRSPDGNFTQLTFWPFNIDKGKRYRLVFEMKSDKEATVNIRIRGNHAEAKVFGLSANVPIDTAWKTYSFSFEATDSVIQKVAVGFIDFQDNTVYEVRRVSLREILQ